MNKKWFKDKLLARGISQSKLAKSMNLREAAISEILNNKREISFDEAHKICLSLNCSFDALYTALKDKEVTEEWQKPHTEYDTRLLEQAIRDAYEILHEAQIKTDDPTMKAKLIKDIYKLLLSEKKTDNIEAPKLSEEHKRVILRLVK